MPVASRTIPLLFSLDRWRHFKKKKRFEKKKKKKKKQTSLAYGARPNARTLRRFTAQCKHCCCCFGFLSGATSATPQANRPPAHKKERNKIIARENKKKEKAKHLKVSFS